MSIILDELLYTKTHEWIKVKEDIGIIGITDFAQKELSDIIFIGIDENLIGKSLGQGDKFGYLEAVKTASDLYIPVSGEVLEINQEVKNRPQLVNESPYEKGWLLKIRVSDKNELAKLLKSEQYKAHIGE